LTRDAPAQQSTDRGDAPNNPTARANDPPASYVHGVMTPVPDDCPFCRIAAGDEQAFVVYESDEVVAFLDARPVFPGHTLVMPRRHVLTYLDLPAELIGPFFAAGQQITAAVTEGMNAQGTFVAMNNVVSQSVPHLHLHVVPRTKGDGLRGFFWPRRKYAGGEAEQCADRIRAAVASR
jgi:histidine triad (HIT) family protein